MTYDEAKALIAALVTLRESATDEQAVVVPILYPTWKEATTYTTGERVSYNNILYKVLQDHASQTEWTPDVSPSLFAKVLIPDADTIPAWEQPESTNGYMTGDKVVHDDKTWVSTCDNNVWEPGVHGWTEVI